jgi:hypothetical protein
MYGVLYLLTIPPYTYVDLVPVPASLPPASMPKRLFLARALSLCTGCTGCTGCTAVHHLQGRQGSVSTGEKGARFGSRKDSGRALIDSESASHVTSLLRPARRYVGSTEKGRSSLQVDLMMIMVIASIEMMMIIASIEMMMIIASIEMMMIIASIEMMMIIASTEMMMIIASIE